MTMPVGDDRKEHFWERREREKEERDAQAAGVLSQIEAHLGFIRSLALAPPADDVLFSGTAQIGADGTFRREFKQPFAAAMILNPGPSSLTLVGSATAGTAPAIGAGIAHVLAGSYRLINLRPGAALTVMGTAGATFDLEVYLRHRPPLAGVWGSRAPFAPTVVQVPTPAAGANFSWTAPAGAPIELQSINCKLVTSATAANRTPYFTVTGPTGRLLVVATTSGFQVATRTFIVQAAVGATQQTLGTHVFAMPLPKVVLPGGCTVASAVLNLQAGDQLSTISLVVGEFGA